MQLSVTKLESAEESLLDITKLFGSSARRDVCLLIFLK